ncbi:MAG: hypothetical protein KC535_04565 [Nanoarchaeota archaeon]|nr:hypothetical protein [Nanoarchaeota archaeon]
MIPEVQDEQIKNIRRSGVACDLDDVLMNTKPFLFSHFKSLFGSIYSPEVLYFLYHTPSRNPEWDTPEKRAIIEEHLNRPELYRDIPLLKESKRTLLELQKNELFNSYITARPHVLDKVTKSYLKSQELPDLPLVSRYFPNKYHQSNGQWKATVLDKLFPKVRGIIDNGTDLFNQLERTKYPGFMILFGEETLPFQPHFEAYAAPDWQAVKEILLSKC